jgi:hypothetical protein
VAAVAKPREGAAGIVVDARKGELDVTGVRHDGPFKNRRVEV